MKVLFLVPYIHIGGYSGLDRFRVGAAFTFNSIANELGKSNDVYVYVQCGMYKSGDAENLHLIGKGVHSILKPSLYYFRELIRALKKERHFTVSTLFHYAYYYLAGPDIEGIIQRIRPDIVSIRNGEFSTEACIHACERQGVKYVISSHGLACTVNDGSIRDSIKELEKDLYRYANKNNIPMTVISSGMKKRISTILKLEDNDNIHVILNGVDKVNKCISSEMKDELRKKIDAKEGDKIIISAGSISTRKNQTQIVRAYSLLPPEIRNTTILLVLGAGDQRSVDDLNRTIAEVPEPKRIKYCGFIPIEEIPIYFEIADLNVIASLDEGFGRAFIEGFVAGIPSVAFADLDAVNDLYDKNAMVKVTGRSDKELSDGIASALKNHWDKEYIVEYAKKFSVNNMANNYMKLYKEVIGNSIDNGVDYA